MCEIVSNRILNVIKILTLELLRKCVLDSCSTYLAGTNASIVFAGSGVKSTFDFETGDLKSY